MCIDRKYGWLKTIIIKFLMPKEITAYKKVCWTTFDKNIEPPCWRTPYQNQEIFPGQNDFRTNNIVWNSTIDIRSLYVGGCHVYKEEIKDLDPRFFYLPVKIKKEHIKTIGEQERLRVLTAEKVTFPDPLPSIDEMKEKRKKRMAESLIIYRRIN